MYYFYLLRCKDNSLYSGITNNLEERMKKHNSGTGSKYVWSRGGGILAYSEKHSDKTKALIREHQVKQMTKSEKEELIKHHQIS